MKDFHSKYKKEKQNQGIKFVFLTALNKTILSIFSKLALTEEPLVNSPPSQKKSDNPFFLNPTQKILKCLGSHF